MFYPATHKNAPSFVHFNERVELYAPDGVIMRRYGMESIVEFKMTKHDEFTI